MLLFDNRPQLGASPATHALIVGIDRYPYLPKDAEPDKDRYFGLRQLEASVASAGAFVHWLRTEYLNPTSPLGTCRVLASNEGSEEHSLAGAAPPSLDNVLTAAHDWRMDAQSHPDNIAIFYFAGHGLALSRDQGVLLLEGFGKPVGPWLWHGIDLSTLITGMAPTSSRPDIARTQLFFVDTDRVPAVSVGYLASGSTTALWDIELPGIDDRATLIARASSLVLRRAPGTPAVASPFVRVLVEAFRGAAADTVGENAEGEIQWGVTLASLTNALPVLVDQMNRETGGNLEFSSGGSFRPVTLHYLPGPPEVAVRLSIESPNPHPKIQVRLYNAETELRLDGTLATQEFRVPAGLYNLEVSAPAGRMLSRVKEARAPRSHWKIKLPE